MWLQSLANWRMEKTTAALQVSLLPGLSISAHLQPCDQFREKCSATLHRAAQIAVNTRSSGVLLLTLSLACSGGDALLDGA